MSVLKILDNGTWYDVSATSVVEESNSIYLTNVPISAVTGDIASIIDSRITSESAVAEVTFANPSAITSDVTWTTGNGSLILNGTCASATTANIVIVHVLDGSAMSALNIAPLTVNLGTISGNVDTTITKDLSSDLPSGSELMGISVNGWLPNTTWATSLVVKSYAISGNTIGFQVRTNGTTSQIYTVGITVFYRTA